LEEAVHACRPTIVGHVIVLALMSALAAAEDEPPDITQLTIEELAQVQVVTVSRRPQNAMEAAAAVSVVSEEDIRRTGASTLPDAFRAVPGVQASRIDADEWALSVRGFSSRVSRSVLVLMDGRSLWTPLFAGVFWNVQDTLFEDVDRIEVSRGPGGATYGANAMNGVISIITKPAASTQGLLATASVGGAETMGGVRWGGQIGARTHYRAYGKYGGRDGTFADTAADYDDSWRMGQVGFRLDSELGARDSFTVQGDVYRGEFGQRLDVAQLAPPFSSTREGQGRAHGGNLLGRWKHAVGAGEVTARVYYDGTSRRELFFEETRDTFDLDVSHRLRWSGRHETIWGVNYRASQGHFRGEPTIEILPERRTDDIAGLFVNNETRLWRERLRVTLGSKLEWNDYSGWNLQPSARVAWVQGAHTVWAAATRAVRTSSRIERDVSFYIPTDPVEPTFTRLLGSPDFRPESVLMLEAGAKLRAGKLIGAASVFHGFYGDLAGGAADPPTLEGGIGGEPIRAVTPVRIVNAQTAAASGVEVDAIVDPLPTWRLRAGYSWYRLDVRAKPPEPDPQGGFEGTTPRHQLWLSSYFNPIPSVDVDLVLRHIAEVPEHSVKAFTDLDARIAHRPWRRLELAVVGRNLLTPRHAEFEGGVLVERHLQAQAIVRW
jgi:iron complex outermembrane recepter protein